MPLSSNIKAVLNGSLAAFNLTIGTLTADRLEDERLSALDKDGHFSNPIFPTLQAFQGCDYQWIIEAVRRFRHEMEPFNGPPRSGEYSFANDYFGSPDAEVAYALARQLRPRRIIEVGSGNSTRLFREAIRIGALETELISIDPSPRVDIGPASDKVIRSPIEQLPSAYLGDHLASGDFLFIDSSHEIRIANDVLTLLLHALPTLKSGVVIHLHDIFLPYDYPREWIIANRWRQLKEQYMVQALLQESDVYKVLWPGHYLQRVLVDFAAQLGSKPEGVAKSLWLQRNT
jgi:hypothetical protein